MNQFLSDLISANKTGFNTNHVLLKLIKIWKATGDTNLFIWAVLVDFSIAFDCISHDLLTAKLHDYGLAFKTIIF